MNRGIIELFAPVSRAEYEKLKSLVCVLAGNLNELSSQVEQMARTNATLLETLLKEMEKSKP